MYVQIHLLIFIKKKMRKNMKEFYHIDMKKIIEITLQGEINYAPSFSDLA